MNEQEPGSRLVRFRDDEDTRVWRAVHLADDRWTVSSSEGRWTYKTEELEFISSVEPPAPTTERT